MYSHYNAQGLRIGTEESGIYYGFTFERGSIITEVDSNNQLISRSIRGYSLIANKDKREVLSYYLHNSHGDITNLVDENGQVLNSYDYDAFGNTLNQVEQVSNRFMYAGEQFDKVTEHYYLRARYYAPNIGRFTQEDTYRGDGLNLYAYVSNNPVMYVDPSGYCKGGVYSSTPSYIVNSPRAYYTGTGPNSIHQMMNDSNFSININDGVEINIDNTQILIGNPLDKFGNDLNETLGYVAEELNVSMLEEVNLVSIKSWVGEMEINLSVGSSNRITTNSWGVSEDKIEVYNPLVNLGGLEVYNTLSGESTDDGLVLTDSINMDSEYFSYSNSSSISLDNTVVSQSISTNPSNGDSIVTLSMSTELTNKKVATTAGIIFAGIKAYKILPFLSDLMHLTEPAFNN